jgi:hypothetical protein
MPLAHPAPASGRERSVTTVLLPLYRMSPACRHTRSGARRRHARMWPLALLAACGGESPTDPPARASLGPLTMPLAVGTRWTYSETDSVEGAVRPQSPGVLVVTVVKDTVFGGRRAAVLDRGRELYGHLGGPLAVATDRSGVLTAPTDQPYRPPRARTRSPSRSVSRDARYGVRVWMGRRSRGNDARGAAGTFRCVRYDLRRGGAVFATIFFAPQVGVVWTRSASDQLTARRAVA